MSAREPAVGAHESTATGRGYGPVDGCQAQRVVAGEDVPKDAREESAGAHFREEYQTEDGEALRDDDRFCHVAAWEYAGEGNVPNRLVEPLVFENVPLQTRSYK